MSSSEEPSTGTTPKAEGPVLADQLAIAILVFSTLAFVVVSVQFVQSILADAKGLPSCDKRVLGRWARRSGLRFWHWRIWRYLRIEVEFESPIIFVALQGNERGPLQESPIYEADGTKKSQDKWKVDLAEDIIRDKPANHPDGVGHARPTAEHIRRLIPRIFHNGAADDEHRVENGAAGGPVVVEPQPLGRERVTTVDRELVSWIALLVAVQRMENESDAWTKTQVAQPTAANVQTAVTEVAPPAAAANTGLVVASPAQRRIAVAIQIKRRTFETNPYIKKPYATTTICHIVELAALLGLYWNEFDRDRDRYRAEGNGFTLVGSWVMDVGLVFTFEQIGWPVFTTNRTIPSHDVKEFCFGNSPTIFRKADNKIDWLVPFTGEQDPKLGVQTLHLGSRKEIAETLTAIGCNTKTAFYILKTGYKHSHLFSVVFEVLGMIGRVVHMQGTCYSYLPNPTIFPWNRSTFVIRRLLKSYRANIEKLMASKSLKSRVMVGITKSVQELDDSLPDKEDEFSLVEMNRIHTAIELADETLKDKPLSGTGENAVRSPADTEIVFDVLRRHIQEVLGAINSKETQHFSGSVADNARLWDLDLTDQSHQVSEAVAHQVSHFEKRIKQVSQAMQGFMEALSAQSGEKGPQGPKDGEGSAATGASVIEGVVSFDVLFSIPPEKQEDKLMEMYFDLIRPRAISRDNKHHDQAAVQRTQELQPNGSDDSKNDAADGSGSKGEGSGKVIARSKETTGGQQIVKGADSVGNDIWCTLVYRMICWLLLHNFDKRDVQIPKSELIGSRTPVSIV